MFFSKHRPEFYCTHYFSCHCDQVLHRGQLEEGFIVGQFEVIVHPDGKALTVGEAHSWDSRAAGHIWADLEEKGMPVLRLLVSTLYSV